MNFKYLKSRLFSAAIAVGCAAMFTACTDDIELGKAIDEDPYQNIYQNNGFLRDAKTNSASNVAELHGATYEASLKLGLTKAPEAAMTAKAAFDAAYLAVYNKEHNTDFELYPADKVVLGNGGVFSIDAKSYFSSEMPLTIMAAEGLNTSKTYVVPIAVTESSSDLSLKESAKYCVYLVKDLRAVQDCSKGEDLPKGYLFIEVNDVNPLNTLSFELENGKLLWDVVVLFAANINYNSATQRPYLLCNPNVQYLLDNNEKFLQPLRKRGVKVLLGILGNHDIAGVAQLSKTGAQDFAKELAAYCEAYNLDGVNFDDEYSKYPDLSNPAFVSPGPAAAARLCYETKKVMPQHLVTTFAFGNMYGTSTVDGVDVDNWMDIVVANYGSTSYPIGNMTNKKCSAVSMEFWLGFGGSLDDSTAKWMVDRGYGWFMGFAPHPQHYLADVNGKYGNDIFGYFLSGCETLYGSPLKAPTVFYRKNDSTPYKFPDEFTAADRKE